MEYSRSVSTASLHAGAAGTVTYEVDTSSYSRTKPKCDLHVPYQRKDKSQLFLLLVLWRQYYFYMPFGKKRCAIFSPARFLDVIQIGYVRLMPLCDVSSLGLGSAIADGSMNWEGSCGDEQRESECILCVRATERVNAHTVCVRQRQTDTGANAVYVRKRGLEHTRDRVH
jgi:hypothetical protein